LATAKIKTRQEKTEVWSEQLLYFPILITSSPEVWSEQLRERPASGIQFIELQQSAKTMTTTLQSLLSINKKKNDVMW
jgi:hypothetical protein